VLGIIRACLGCVFVSETDRVALISKWTSVSPWCKVCNGETGLAVVVEDARRGRRGHRRGRRGRREAVRRRSQADDGGANPGTDDEAPRTQEWDGNRLGSEGSSSSSEEEDGREEQEAALDGPCAVCCCCWQFWTNPILPGHTVSTVDPESGRRVYEVGRCSLKPVFASTK